VIATDASFALRFVQSVASTAAVKNISVSRRGEQHLCRKRNCANQRRRRTPLRFLIAQELQMSDTPTQIRPDPGAQATASECVVEMMASAPDLVSQKCMRWACPESVRLGSPRTNYGTRDTVWLAEVTCFGGIDRMQLANCGLCVRSHPPNASCQIAAAGSTDAPQQTHG